MSTQLPEPAGHPIPAHARVAIVAARFNAKIVNELLAGCVRRFAERGLGSDRVDVHRVPGAFELPVIAKALADSGKYSAVVCLGCVVRGDTPHFDFVAGEASRGIQQVAIATSLPIIFGVLTTNTEQQAWDRAGGSHGHGGIQSADAALEMIAVLAHLRA